MSISDLVPNLQPMVEDLSQQLRFICYFVLTAAIVVRTGRGSMSVGQLVRPIVTNIILCGIISTLPMWFNLIRDEFWNIAVSIRKEFTGSVDGTGAALMQLPMGAPFATTLPAPMTNGSPTTMSEPITRSIRQSLQDGSMIKSRRSITTEPDITPRRLGGSYPGIPLECVVA